MGLDNFEARLSFELTGQYVFIEMMILLSILARHERTQFFLCRPLGTINSHPSFKSFYDFLLFSLPMRSTAGVKNNNLVFSTIVTLKITNSTEHSVFLGRPAVASFSSANGVGEFGAKKFMSAFRAAEIKRFVTNPNDYCRLFPIKTGTAL